MTRSLGEVTHEHSGEHKPLIPRQGVQNVNYMARRTFAIPFCAAALRWRLCPLRILTSRIPFSSLRNSYERKSNNAAQPSCARDTHTGHSRGAVSPKWAPLCSSIPTTYASHGCVSPTPSKVNCPKPAAAPVATTDCNLAAALVLALQVIGSHVTGRQWDVTMGGGNLT